MPVFTFMEAESRRAGFMRHIVWVLLIILSVVCAGTAHAARPTTVGDRYPDLAPGILGSAGLAALDEKTLLAAEGFTITLADLTDQVQRQAPGVRAQLEKNLLFLLEQETTRRLLLTAAKSAGIAISDGDENEALQELLESRVENVDVSEADLQAFYKANREMMGGAPYDQVKEGVRQHLIQEKRQQGVLDYIENLGKTTPMRINETWMATQHKLAIDNPVDKARRSGKPTMVEFGAAGCVPCDMMQPILDTLKKEYAGRLNVIFVHVGEEKVLGARYGIRSIPVQAFFDADGKEVFRHVGFFPEVEVKKQLSEMGLEKKAENQAAEPCDCDPRSVALVF